MSSFKEKTPNSLQSPAIKETVMKRLKLG